MDLRDELDAIARRLTAAIGASRSRSPAALVRGGDRVLARTSTPAFLADDAGRYLTANAAALDVVQMTVGNLRMKGVWELTWQADRTDFDVLWRAFLRAGSQWGEYNLVRSDGTIVKVEYAAQASVAPGVHLSLLKPT